ncbi:MFS transporter [Bacteroides intestinalis]|uniref:MFS transporter n=1 Tax=Bacteroides intestinalis TaxID=329854 RepID=A0A412Y0W1_9BACE|nr:MFS transporter [Bacteroides intestinalis]RHA57066.1 MFS transporter [Bacteroides intestinalis]
MRIIYVAEFSAFHADTLFRRETVGKIQCPCDPYSLFCDDSRHFHDDVAVQCRVAILCNGSRIRYNAGFFTLSRISHSAEPLVQNPYGVFIGICSAGSGIGGVLFNPLAGFLITEYGWRMTYLIFGIIIMVIVTPILGLLLRDYPEDKGLKPYGEAELSDTVPSRSDGKQSTGDGVEYAHAVRMPIFYGLIVFAFLMNATATLNVFVPTYMQEILFSVEQASFVASAVMVGVTVGKVLLGMINDRSTLYGILTTIGLGISGLVLLLMGHIGITLSIIGGFLFGWAYAGVTVQTPMLVRSVFGNKNYAQIYSNVSMAIAIGGAIAAGGWGLLADATSYGFIFIVGIVFLVLSGSIGLFALYIRRKT